VGWKKIRGSQQKQIIKRLMNLQQYLNACGRLEAVEATATPAKAYGILKPF